jgi:hypothetical protein
LVLVVAPTVAPTLVFFLERCVGDPGAYLGEIFRRMKLVAPYRSRESRCETSQPDLVVTVTVMFHGHLRTFPTQQRSLSSQ